MKRNGFLIIILLLVPFFTERNISAQEILEISVQSDKPGAEIQPAMWGKINAVAEPLSVSIFIIDFKSR